MVGTPRAAAHASASPRSVREGYTAQLVEKEMFAQEEREWQARAAGSVFGEGWK